MALSSEDLSNGANYQQKPDNKGSLNSTIVANFSTHNRVDMTEVKPKTIS